MTTPTPLVGLIVPPGHGRVPVDGPTLYPYGVRFTAAGLGLDRMTADGYDAVIDRAEVLTRDLVAQGADAVSLMGTSLSFYRGARAHEELLGRLRLASGGRPVTTMARGVVRALRHLGIQRLAVGTAYRDEVTMSLVDFLQAEGFAVTCARGLGLTGVEAVAHVGTDSLVGLAEDLLSDPDGAASQGVLLSCGGLRTLDALTLLESRWGRPVVASSPAGFWDAVRILGLTGESRHPAVLFRGGAGSGY